MVALFAPAVTPTPPPKGLTAFYTAKIETAEQLIATKTQNLRRLEAQRNSLNARGELLRPRLKPVLSSCQCDCCARSCSSCKSRDRMSARCAALVLAAFPRTHTAQVVRVMGRKKILVKARPPHPLAASC
jgi:hypothetical protein